MENSNPELTEYLEGAGLFRNLPEDLRTLGSQQGREILKEVISLAEFAAQNSAPEEVLREVVKGYVANPNPYTFERCCRRILQAAYDLPPEIVDINRPVDFLLDLAGDLIAVGEGDWSKALSKPEALDALRSGKRASEVTKAVVAEPLSRSTGIPLEVIKRQPLKRSIDGMGYAQSLGYEDAVKDPEFWEDFSKGPGEGMFKKWNERKEEAEKERKAEADRKTGEAIKKWRRGLIDRELENRRNQRAIDKARKLKTKKKKVKRRRIRGTVSSDPSQIEIAQAIPIVTRHGSHFVLIAYHDDSSEIIRTTDGKVVLARGHWGYMVSKSHLRGRPYVEPVFGSRREPIRKRAAKSLGR